MFENEAKGWYGSYSRIGKGYAERFYIISHKDEIFSRENKKIRIKDFFNPDEIKQKPDLEENLDVFKVYTSNTKNKIKYLKALLKPKRSFLDSFHQRKIFKKRKLKFNNNNTYDSKNAPELHQPPCTRYNPNYNYIKPKLLEGPLWKDIPGRNQKGLNPNDDKIFSSQIEDNKNYKYYILEGEKTKCLVNMNKTTQRGEFSDIKDLRIRTDKPFIKPKKKRNKTLQNKLKSKKSKINNIKNKTINDFYSSRNLSLNNKSYRLAPINKFNSTSTIYSKPRELLEKEIQNISNINNSKNTGINKNITGISRKKINKVILNQICVFGNRDNDSKIGEVDSPEKEASKKKLINLKSSPSSLKEKNIEYKSLTERSDKSLEKKEIEKNKNIKKIKAPDFNKIISREQVEKALGPKHYMIPFITPNYNLVTERSLTMTDFDKNKSRSNPKDNKYKPFDFSLNYKPDELIDKYNNHNPPKVPNFDYMTSRPNKKNCALPTYMQNVHDRLSLNNLNDKSLFLNNYSNRGYHAATTTFFPKKSFNNIINYSIINSMKNIEKEKDEDVEKKYDLLKIQTNYEPEKYKQLVQEGTINKFDKITLKTYINQKNDENKINNKNKYNFDIII